MNVQGSTEAAKIAPSPTPVVATSEEMEKVEKNIQLVMNKINGLEGKSDENSGQLPVAGGQLGKGKKSRNSGVGFRVSEHEVVSV